MALALLDHFDSCPIGFCVIDQALQVVHMNAWLTRYAAQENVQALPIAEALPIFDPGLESSIREVLETGKAEHHKLIQHETSEGLEKSFRRSIQLMRDEAGEVCGVSCLVEDVTEMLDVVRVLNSVLEQRRLGITVWNQDLELTLTNKVAEAMLELPEGWLQPGRSFEDGLRFLASQGEYGEGDIEELVRTRLERARRFQPHSFQRITKDGRTLEITGAPLPSGGFVSTHLDISEHTQQLRSCEDKYRRYVEKSPSGIFIFDADLQIVDVNGSASAMTGYSADELLCMRLPDLVAQEDTNPEDFLSDQGSDGQQFLFRGKAGSIFVVLLYLDVLTDSRRMATCTDISARIRLQQEAQRLEERSQHVQKMEAIGRLAGGVAHDFNNMLSAITGNADLGMVLSPEGTPAHECLSEIQEAAAHAAVLTQQLLAFSRQQANAPRIVDLGQQVSALAPMLQRVIGENIELQSTAAREPTTVRLDPGQLEQIIMNLTLNARDAMPGGGRLEIHASRESQSGSELVRLQVQDTGCGMSEETRARIFEPFFTTKEQGTGLGLATVFGIVQQNQGSIDVESTLGEGTIVSVNLPFVSAAMAVKEEPQELLMSAGETVLVVEDNDKVRRSTVQMLRALNYQVLEAASGPEALELSSGYEERIDLLLSDVLMPVMTGPELAAELLPTRPETKILFVSGFADDVITPDHWDEVELLPKPFTLHSLSQRLRAILDD